MAQPLPRSATSLGSSPRKTAARRRAPAPVALRVRGAAVRRLQGHRLGAEHDLDGAAGRQVLRRLAEHPLAVADIDLAVAGPSRHGAGQDVGAAQEAGDLEAAGRGRW
ncbi:MAG: hypothetical protein U1E53_33840 [Dongiaceae bacterium]